VKRLTTASLKVPLFLLLATLPNTASATAAGDVVYPGVMCRYYGTQNTDTFLDPNGWHATGLQNDASTSQKIDCPILKPLSNSIDLLSVRTSTTGATCFLYSVLADGAGDVFAYYPLTRQGTVYSLQTPGDTRLYTTTLYCSVFPAGAVMYEYVAEWAPPT
jgi:hypothetical protein